MDVKLLGFGRDQGNAYVELEINGVCGKVFLGGQKLLYYGYDLVFLGSTFERVVPEQRIPPDPENGRPSGMTVRGFSNDPQVLDAYRRLREWSNND